MIHLDDDTTWVVAQLMAWEEVHHEETLGDSNSIVTKFYWWAELASFTAVSFISCFLSLNYSSLATLDLFGHTPWLCTTKEFIVFKRRHVATCLYNNENLGLLYDFLNSKRLYDLFVPNL